MRNFNDKKSKIFVMVLFFLSIGFISAESVNDTLHINVQTTFSNGSVQAGTFAFAFNITENSSSSCGSPIVYNYSITETTDVRGIASIYLPTIGSGGGNLSGLAFDRQYYLCYSRDGTLRNVSQLGRVPYSFKTSEVNLSDVVVDSNLTLGNFNVSANTGFFTNIGSLINRITNIFTSNLNVGNNLSVLGNFSVNGSTFFVNVNNSRIGINNTAPNHTLDVLGNIYASGNFKFNDTNFSLTIGTLTSSTLASVTAVGYRAGLSNSQDTLTALGTSAANSNTGTFLTAIGASSGLNNQGDFGTFVGRSAGGSNSGDSLTAVGYLAGNNNQGNDSTLIGLLSGFSSNGNVLTALGSNAGREQNGSNIVAIGYDSGRNNTGNNSVFIGYEAGENNILNNIFILKHSQASSNPLIFGNFSSERVGIGTTTPNSTLSVLGSFDVNEALAVNTSGRVGIGTMAPEYPFHFSVSVPNGAANATFENPSGNINSDINLILKGNDGGTEVRDLLIKFIPNLNSIGSGSSAGYFGFNGTRSSFVLGELGIGGVPKQPILTINTSSGNTGINTSTPKNTLNVVGSFNLTGDLFLQYIEANITASSNQSQGQRPLNATINIVENVNNSSDVVTLPPAVAGRVVIIKHGDNINTGNSIQVYPALGDAIDGLTPNFSTVITDYPKGMTFVASDSTNWWIVGTAGQII